MARKISAFTSFSAELARDGWRSPQSYGRDYAAADDFPAVYMFLVVDDFVDMNFHVAYVGMSKRLATRWSRHPTLRTIKQKHHWVKKLFKPTDIDLLREEERRYIQQFTPPWNIIGRVPGR